MKCFHHNDIDGRCAGSIIARFENDYDPSHYFDVNYTQELPIDDILPGEKVYFVDYSFSLNTENVLREILKKTRNLVWIDHHISSIDLVRANPEFKSIRGIVKEGISGAALTCMYLFGLSYSDIPLYIRHVSDFDCKHMKMPDTLEFKYGVECHDYSALSDFWIRLDESDYGGDTRGQFLSSIIDMGRTVKKYYDSTAKAFVKENAYECTIEGYKALVVNRDGSSLLFGDNMGKYDVCIIWRYSGGKYTYSIYSETVDVSKIAEKYGGGGHPGASGFSSNELLFK